MGQLQIIVSTGKKRRIFYQLFVKHVHQVLRISLLFLGEKNLLEHFQGKFQFNATCTLHVITYFQLKFSK